MTPEECDQIEEQLARPAAGGLHYARHLCAAWRAERLAKEKAERERDEARFIAQSERDAALETLRQVRDARGKARAAVDLYARGHAGWIASTTPARDRKACAALGRTDPDHPDCTCGLREARAALRG